MNKEDLDYDQLEVKVYVTYKGKEYLLLTAFFMGKKPLVSFNILNKFIQEGYSIRITDVNACGAPKKDSPLADFLPHLF